MGDLQQPNELAEVPTTTTYGYQGPMNLTNPHDSLPALPEPARKPFFFCAKCGYMGQTGPAQITVRHNEDGTLDEVVGVGQFHLEQMDDNHWWMQLGPHAVDLSAKGKIRATISEGEFGPDHFAGVGNMAPDGYVLVPREPTEAMLMAAEEVYTCGYTGTPTATPDAVYRAMLAAAGKEGGQ